MVRGLTQTETRLLVDLAGQKSKDGLKLARRAWCLLEPDLSSKDLSSNGLSEDRILAIRSQFEDMGLVGLTDAPRQGRPASVSADTRTRSSECVVTAGTGSVPTDRAQRERLWRSLRQRDSKVDPIRSWSVDMPMQSLRNHSHQELVGLWIASGTIAAAYRAKESVGFIYGKWCRPPAGAKLAYSASAKNAAHYESDLHRAIHMHATHPSNAKTRAEAEKLEYWCDCVAKTATANQCELFVHALKPSESLIALLKCLRKHALWCGPGGALKQLGFLDRPAWEAMSRGTFRQAIEFVRPASATFSWIAIPRHLK